MVYMKQKLSHPLSLRIERKVRKAHRIIDNPLHDNPKGLTTIFESPYKFVERTGAVGNLKFGVICANIYAFMKKELDRTGKIRTRSLIRRRIGHLVDCSSLETYAEKMQAKAFFRMATEETAKLLEKRTNFDTFSAELLYYYQHIELHPETKAGFNGLQVAMIRASVDRFIEKIGVNRGRFIVHDSRETVG